jgi:hypothetical protein
MRMLLPKNEPGRIGVRIVDRAVSDYFSPRAHGMPVKIARV